MNDAPQVDANATRIIVQNLSFGTTQDDLAEFFRTFAGSATEVTDVLVATDPTGRSKGFGFVTFATNETLRKAVADTTLELDGRTLRVQVANARSKESTERRAPRAPREVKAVGPKLYCGDLPWELSSDELAAHFAPFGTVEDAYLAEVQFAAQVNGYKPHRGFGFVVFSSEEEATKALSQSKHVVKGATIRVTSAKGEASERRKPRTNAAGEGGAAAGGGGGERRTGERNNRKAGEGDAASEGGAGQRKPRNEGGNKEGGNKEGGNKEGGNGASRKKERDAGAAPAAAAAAPAGAAAAAAAPKRAPEKAKATGIKVPPAPKVSPWANKKGGDASAAVSAEDYPSLADVASGKIKAKPVDDAPAVAAAVTAAPAEKGKEEAN